MANALTSGPNTYTFGDNFNYGQWTENTTLTLINVPWNNDYRDVWRASSRSALDSWIDGNADKLVLQNVSLAKFDRNVRVNTPINRAMQHNYLRAANGAAPTGDTQRTYYYFILDYKQIAPNTTELMLQLDVWQTFGYDVTLGNCFIERGHIGIANTNAFNNYGRDYLSIPEGLDVGAEYQIVKTASQTVMDTSGSNQYSVMIVSTVDITQDPGTVKAPKLTSAKGSIVDGIASGASIYIFPTPADFTQFIKDYQKMPWITQGIISATLIPPITRYYPSATLTNVAGDVQLGSATLPDGSTITVVGTDFTVYNYPSGTSVVKSESLLAGWRDVVKALIPSQYQMLTKLLTFPYCVVELTTWTGQPLAIRPEAWADPDATIREQAVMLPPGQRIAFMPFRYNASSSTTAGTTDDQAEYLDFATTLDNFPQVPIVNNMALSWLASNKNGLAFQFHNASWDQQKALRGAQATYDVANSDIKNTGRQAGILNSAAAAANIMQVDTATLNQQIGAMSGGLNALGTMSMGAEPLALSEVGGVIGKSLQQSNESLLQSNLLANSNQARSNSAISSIETSGAIRDTNVSLARFAARGDYANNVQGINAKIQDARMTQPSTSGQFGGDAMNLAHGKFQVSARFKMIDPATMRRIGNFWLRYGYAVEQFSTNVPANFQCMSKFTYWKMSETYITAARIPEQFKQAIRGIFEKGVTVWGDPGYIGTTALSDNQPLPGITL